MEDRCKSVILEVTLPQFAPNAHPHSQAVRKVRLYYEDRNTIWLCIDDAYWAMSYLRDQLQLQTTTLDREGL